MLFAFLVGLVQTVPVETVAPVAAGVMFAGAALVALMRKHKVKNKELADQLGVPVKEVTAARKYGITDPQKGQLWNTTIASKPVPEKKSRRRRRKSQQTAEQAQEVPAAEPSQEAPAEASPPVETGDTAPVQKLLLPPNLAALTRLVAKNQHSRFGATTGVHLSTTADGGFRAEATDGRVLGIVTGKLADASKYPDVPPLQCAPNGQLQGTIPADVWSRAFKAVPNPRKVSPILGNLAVVFGNNQATLVSTDLENVNVLTPRLVEGRFPDTDKIVPKDKARLSVNVDAKLLIELLQTAMAFSSPDQNNRVTIEFYDAKRPFVVRSSTDDGPDFLGMAVPLVIEGQKKKAFSGVHEAQPAAEKEAA